MACFIFFPSRLAGQISGAYYNLPLVLAAGEQNAPALVSDGQGGAFVIWHDKRESRTAIYAQHLNEVSQPTWKQDGIPVAVSAKDQLALTAISDGKNGVMIFWQDLRNDTGDIYGQCLDKSGKLLWGAAGVEVIRASGKQAEPKVITDGAGGAFVLCHDFKSGNEDIAVQRIDNNGKILFEPAGRSVVAGGGNQILGDAAATTDGGFVAVWSDNSAGLPRLAAQRFDSKASPLGPAPVFVTNTRSTQISPVVYFSPNANTAAGNTFVVWSDNRNRHFDLFAQKIDALGLPQWSLPGVTVCKASNDQLNPQIASDGGDGFFVAWEDQRSGKTDIYAQALNASGQTRWQSDGVALVATSQEQTQPRLIADGSGGLIGVWTDERHSGTNIAAQRLDKHGQALWEMNGIFITNAGGAKQRPAILSQPGAFLGANGFFTAWEDSRRGNQDIFFQALKGDGALANVPPIIISYPKTETPAGSLYTYQVEAYDFDSADPFRLELVKPSGTWLQVDAAKLQLFGTPAANDAGEIAVTLAVKDNLGARTTQSFVLKVIYNPPPDLTAPAAPQAVHIEPAQWSANKKFTLRWQNPFDPSRVTGAFYKIGAPPTHNQDGVFVAGAEGVTIDQLELLATKEGKTPVYLWLMDGRGNVDFRNTATVSYRYDATPPTPAQNLSPNRQWTRGDSLLLQWTPSTDATSGIRRYHFFLDGKFFGFINGNAGSFRLILQLSENAHGWTLMPEDSAGNLGGWVGATFKVDRTPPTLLHTAVDTTTAQTDLVLTTQAQDALSKIHTVRLFHRPAGASNYRMKNLQPATHAVFSTRLEAAEIVSRGLEYFLEAADSAGNRSRSSVHFHATVTASENIVAPMSFAANRYHIFSVPYRLSDDSPANLLEDDLGRYDPAVWRLFRYQPGAGNVEFGKADFENFAPGRAFWLITTTPKNFDTGPVHSVKTAAPFELSLQPGWNLIATPFDFPTAWTAAQKPAYVENNLWAFDGAKYLDQQKSLMPWQGYFVRNLETQPQTLRIFPVAANQTNKPEALSAAIDWQVQLRVFDGEFSDEANYLGVAASAVEAWDPLDLSEPPAIGDHVSLYFDRRDWPRFAGKFTRDFRPSGNAAQKWPFTVFASRAGLPVELTWNFSGDFPDDFIFVLEDVGSRVRRQIRPKDFHAGEKNYIFRAAPQPRQFIWWAGKAAPLAETGALQNLIPTNFELLPSYPNPLRLAEWPAIGVIRFGLPAAATVRLTIFDVIGRAVRTLIDNKNLNAGYHEASWNGRDDAGRDVAAGIYLYRLETADFSASRKLILLR
ncbi:MAG: putative Ig domain-containing protein [candidate division KSB1 bacterium]|nr:putative Ig domain-containing protein [candidate division KSB1 bacterium]MDZ7365453.1 putative Ig domain-containing protein [candidate division KSB1 bacterium]MDZ7403500.1 putative Ig domain-containing protein [candidate division KSB1 bacterium]